MQRRVLRPYPSITVLLEGAYTRTVHRCSYRNIHVELFFAAFFGLCRASTPQKSGPLTNQDSAQDALIVGIMQCES